MLHATAARRAQDADALWRQHEEVVQLLDRQLQLQQQQHESGEALAQLQHQQIELTRQLHTTLQDTTDTLGRLCLDKDENERLEEVGGGEKMGEAVRGAATTAPELTPHCAPGEVQSHIQSAKFPAHSATATAPPEEARPA